MTRPILIPIAATAIAILSAPAAAQGAHPHLHINTRWQECSFQLDASLTQAAWHQFTEEAGLVTYFRPLSDARPMGKGKFEVSLLQWRTSIDDSHAAWNDTFVHPDSAHVLFEGDALAFPGLMVRAGVSRKMDIAAYATKSPGANYGFYGAQVQRAFLGGSSKWGAAARLNFMQLYGPEDLEFGQVGIDLLGSRTFALTRRVSVTPYAGISSYIARSQENSAVVDLDDEIVPGSMTAVGATLNLAALRLGVEYSSAKVNSLSTKVGVGF